MVTTASTLYPGVSYPKPDAPVMRGTAWAEELDTELLRLRALGLSIPEIAANHITTHSVVEPTGKKSFHQRDRRAPHHNSQERRGLVPLGTHERLPGPGVRQQALEGHCVPRTVSIS